MIGAFMHPKSVPFKLPGVSKNMPFNKYIRMRLPQLKSGLMGDLFHCK